MEVTSPTMLDQVVSGVESIGLSCKPTDHAIIHGTYAAPKWSLVACSSNDHDVDVLVASSKEEVAIEVHSLGGAREPQEFRDLRLGSERVLREAMPTAEILEVYPYKSP